ncbi:transmembrane protein [Thalictrum thalictroides]|uniref:Transmembrane protein n=1 Tax=Thalictrum thalictroides TaxID=46969 RepID=A0A7J6XAB2_THATH|nr:transmembrane protein [Thalictrum thalictroides]
MSVSGSFAGLLQINFFKIPFQDHRLKVLRLADSNRIHFASKNIYGNSVPYSASESAPFKCFASLGMNHREPRFNRESPLEPFWVTLTKEAISGLRSLFVFLVEQPGQLKHIEWPSFQSTLKTATLTLVLVVMLIVALSSIDSALSYLLALLLRKTA